MEPQKKLQPKLTLNEIIYGKNPSLIQERLNEQKKEIINSDSFFIKNAILNYFSIINPLSPRWKEQELFDVSEYFVQAYDGNVNIKKLNYVFLKIKDINLKFLVDIENIFPENKKDIKIFFRIILLTKDIQMLKNSIKDIYGDCIKDIENDINNLNFENPFSIIFIHELLKALIEKKNNDEKILPKIINNIKKIQIFRCCKCFDLQYIHHNENGTSLICNDQSHTIINCVTLQNMNNYDLLCCECKCEIKIYYDNYKRIKCKNFICNKCKDKHDKNCLLSELINLYNVGYTCELHNKKYINTCDLCNKNLCEECKSYHFHIIKDNIHLNIDEKEVENSIDQNHLKKTKNYIKYHLLNRYKYMKKLNFVNMKVTKFLHFMINKGNIIYDTNKFFSELFFDNEFKKYYGNIIEESLKGKITEFTELENIERQYKLVNKFKDSEEYNEYKVKSLAKQRKRNDELERFNTFITNALLTIQQLFNNSKMFVLQRKIDENNSNILLLKSKIIKFDKSNKINQLYIKKLLTRYFADYFIKLLIEKYPQKFSSINLSLGNIYEIITNYGLELINNDKLESIKIFIENIISNEKNISNKDKYFIDYIHKIKEENKINFKESIQIGEDIIPKDELNFVLVTLLYLKKIGNSVAHPNIESNTEGEINNITKEVKEIKNLIEQNGKINEPKDENILIDESLINDIKVSLNNVENEILEDFKDVSFEKSADIEYILNYMLKSDSENIIKKDSAFLRAVKIEINNIINEEKDFIVNNLFDDDQEDDMINPNKILEDIENYEKLVKNKISKFKNFDIKENKIFENKVKSLAKNISSLNPLTFSIINDEFENIFDKDFTFAEKKAYILYIFSKEYLEKGSFLQKKENIKKKLKELFKYNIINKKLTKIFKLIEQTCINKDIVPNDDASFINEVKKYVQNRK